VRPPKNKFPGSIGTHTFGLPKRRIIKVPQRGTVKRKPKKDFLFAPPVRHLCPCEFRSLLILKSTNTGRDGAGTPETYYSPTLLSPAANLILRTKDAWAGIHSHTATA